MLMKFIVPMLIGLVCFGLGYLIAPSNTVSDDPTVIESNRDQTGIRFIQNLQQNIPEQSENNIELQQQLKNQMTQVNAVIDQATPQQLDQYLKQAFPSYDLSAIKNKREFAKHLVREFVDAKNNPHEPMSGRAAVMAQQEYGVENVLPRDIYAEQPLYAHFDTMGKVPNNMQVMVRLTHRDSGEVLLFTPRKVSEQQQQNWVSFYPMTGCKTGHYDVKYYQMNDQLSPIAQTSFYIQHVIE
ncbi:MULTISPECIES: hypothetical protein [unclassified Acinetobacter]|uniref:hypothetical protein n=1 Tax=unclassified Acinetobacter TaxID=196816 RepID=UPI0015D29CA4|nr:MULTISPECIES: hypothetical protein [unclassified Acinetobacter]